MVLCTDPILKENLNKKQINAIVFDSILTVSEKQEMLESLDRFASGWFFDKDGKDYTEYRGVSIGAAIHDEVMMLFHMLYHFIYIIDRVGADKPLELYQSKSCRVPEWIKGLITSLGGRVKTLDDIYPYLCFSKFHRFQAANNYTYTDLNISLEDMTETSLMPCLKLRSKVILSRFISSFAFKKRYIYLQVIRSLVPFYDLYLSRKQDMGLILTHNSKVYPDKDHTKRSPFNTVRYFIRLCLKGVQIDTLKKPTISKYNQSSNKKESIKQLLDDFENSFPDSASLLMKNPKSKAADYFIACFKRFYSNILPNLIETIDYYYDKFKNKKMVACLQEVLHPLQAQVLSNLGKKAFIIAPNLFLHNQYFTPYLISSLGSNIKVIAVSEYDKSRYIRHGFEEKNIDILDNLADLLNYKVKPFKELTTFKGAAILIIPPFIPWLHTFRHQYSGKGIMTYFIDIFDLLEEMKVAAVRIRPHPGVEKSLANDTNHTYKDCYRYFIESAYRQNKSYPFDIRFSESYYSNLEEDVNNCDLVIGTISGTMFEVLILGRDYIVYDNSVAPYPGRREGSIVHDGIIKRFRTKDELKKHLLNYKPVERDMLLNRYYPNIFQQGESKKGLDQLFFEKFAILY